MRFPKERYPKKDIHKLHTSGPIPKRVRNQTDKDNPEKQNKKAHGACRDISV